MGRDHSDENPLPEVVLVAGLLIAVAGSALTRWVLVANARARETVRANAELVREIAERARAAGYVLKAYFLWVTDPEITLRRIRQRVAEGGHNIAEHVSRRRFFKTVQNFLTLYSP